MATDGVWHVHHCCPLFFASAALPAICPACQRPLDDTVPQVPLPSPFHAASDHPRAVLIRPTVGRFVDYRGGDLHAGVSDANGGAVAYDGNGLCRQPASEWTQCLVIPLPPAYGSDDSGGDIDDHNARSNAADGTINDVDNRTADSNVLHTSASDRRWDETVASFLGTSDWSADTYHETSRNCFSFVLAFLERARVLPTPGSWTRERFAEQCVLPVSRRAAKYLTLKRRVEKDGWCALGEQAGTGAQANVS